MAAAVTFLQLLEPRPNTGARAARPVCSIPAASCSPPRGPATAAPMSCRLDAAAYWRTSETTASQTFNSVTCLDTWWSSLKTSMDPGDTPNLLLQNNVKLWLLSNADFSQTFRSHKMWAFVKRKTTLQWCTKFFIVYSLKCFLVCFFLSFFPLLSPF